MLDIEQQQIQDRAKRYAQQAYEAPQGRMVGRQYVAPNILQHIAAGLRGYGSIQGMNQSEQELKDLTKNRQEAETKDMGAFVNALRGTPARDAVTLPEDQAGPVMNAQPAVAGNPMDAYSIAAASQSPTVRSMGMQGLAKMPELQAQQQERLDNRAFRAQESELARQARAQELKQRSEDQRNSQAERLAAQRELRQMIQANRPEQQAQIIQTENGPMQLVNGKAQPIIGADGVAVKGKDASKPLNEFQGKSASFGTRAAAAHNLLNELEGTYDPAMTKLNEAGGMLTNWAMSPENQKATQAKRDFINSVLRQESGAAIGASEFANADKQYFPQAGDSKEVLAQKRANREMTIQGFARSAGPASNDVLDVLNAKPKAGGVKPSGNIDSLLDKYK